MLQLFYNSGSPFARAVRIVLAEKGLAFVRHESVVARDIDPSFDIAPTLQVPALLDGDVKLWDSAVILEYLLERFPNPSLAGMLSRPFTADYIRTDHVWLDKLVHATLQTLGEAIVTVSQLERTGLRHEDNAFTQRCSARIQRLLDWCEGQLLDAGGGFVPDAVCVQDVLLVCFCQLLDRRMLRIRWQAPHRRRVAALVAHLAERQSFVLEPVLWWEPGVTYGTESEREWAQIKTLDQGPTLAEWRTGTARG